MSSSTTCSLLYQQINSGIVQLALRERHIKRPPHLNISVLEADERTQENFFEAVSLLIRSLAPPTSTGLSRFHCEG